MSIPSTITRRLSAYYGDDGGHPTEYVDPDGRFGIAGALVGGGLALGGQLLANGGKLHCVNWLGVGAGATLGAFGGAWAKGLFRHSVAGKSWGQASQKWANVSRRFRRARG